MRRIFNWFPTKSGRTWKQMRVGTSFNRVKEIINFLLKSNFNYELTMKTYKIKKETMRLYICKYCRFTGKYIPMFNLSKNGKTNIGRISVQNICKYYNYNGISKTSKMFKMSRFSVKYLINYGRKNEFDFEYDNGYNSNLDMHGTKIIVEDLIKNKLDYEYISNKYNIKLTSLYVYIYTYNKNFHTNVPGYGIRIYSNRFIKKIKDAFYEKNRNIIETANFLNYSIGTIHQAKKYFHLVD